MSTHDYAPLALLGRFLPADGSPAVFIHRCYSREVWRRRGAHASLSLPIAFLMWPLISLIAVSRFTWHNGPAIKKRVGKGIPRQMSEQIFLAFSHSILPRWYYVFELHDNEKRRKARQYLLRFETKGGVYTLLKEKPKSAAPLSPLTDKVLFASRCHEHHVAAVPVVLALEKGIFTYFNGHEPALPKIDLFIKPNHGKGGRGAERWDYQPSGTYKGAGGKELSAAALLHRLKTLPFAEGCLVQPRVVNHPLLVDLSNGALATVRVVTCLNERGEIEVTNAVLRMARGDNTVVDNFHAGGIAAKVDLQSGELGRATDLGVRATTAWCEAHPDTGAWILGRTLPCWNETLDLVRRAHAVFADRVFIGWDVAVLPDGPQLIEGNGAPDLDIIQRTHQEPLGNARFGQILAFHLAQARAAKWRL
jgi:hypothetical protein